MRRAELVERRTEVVAKLKELQVSAEAVVAFLTNPALVKQLRNDKAYNLEMLKNEHQARAQARARAAQTLGLRPPSRQAATRPARRRLTRALVRLQIGEQDIEALYHYAKFQFECGNYSGERHLPAMRF